MAAFYLNLNATTFFCSLFYLQHIQQQTPFNIPHFQSVSVSAYYFSASTYSFNIVVHFAKLALKQQKTKKKQNKTRKQKIFFF